ncbi:hypothetical protein ISS30_04475 [bacterium]|nr:hypothetical protein [bacterium]
MVRISHRTKFYYKQYFTRCIVFGILLGWGESLILWWRLPFEIPLSEALSCSLFGFITGGIAGTAAAAFGLILRNLYAKKKKFDVEIHQTAWTFSSAAALLITGMLLNLTLQDFSIIKLIILLASPLLAFIIIYHFSKQYFFKVKNAGRLTLEIIIILILAGYFLKRPPIGKEIELTESKYPHIFLFDFLNLSYNQIESRLQESLPGDVLLNSDKYVYSIAPFKGTEDNIKSFFAVPGTKGDSSLVKKLRAQEYHTGGFWAAPAPDDKLIQSADVVDDQNYSIKTKLTAAGLISKLLPFIKSNRLINKLEGYDESGLRNPGRLNDRIIFWLNRVRDGRPIFAYIQYPLISGEEYQSADSSIEKFKNLIVKLDKMGLLKNSLCFFTSSGGDDIRKPLFLYSLKWTFGETVDWTAVSLHDINATINDASQGRAKSSIKMAVDLRRVSKGDIPVQRPVFVWENIGAEKGPASSVYSFPYALMRDNSGGLQLIKFADTQKTPGLAPQEEIIDRLNSLIEQPALSEFP